MEMDTSPTLEADKAQPAPAVEMLTNEQIDALYVKHSSVRWIELARFHSIVADVLAALSERTKGTT